MDGTKSTIVPSDVLATSASTTQDKKPDSIAPAVKPTLTTLKRPTIGGALKTILRPGAAQQAKQETTPDSASEIKPAVSSKIVAATPAKSPWAQLPPVDRSAPVPSPPTQYAQIRPRFDQRDAHGFDAMPAPAREIEAESFDRTWRDDNRQGRELFNSHSGRYEPVSGHRRMSRTEPGPRQTSLLHRSPTDDDSRSHADNQHGPRRMSNAGRDQHETRTGIVIGHNLAPQAPKTETTQAQRAQQAKDERQEELAAQKKIMQEKRQAAMERKREEQEREEAAKAERIRAKLDALAMSQASIPTGPVSDALNVSDNPLAVSKDLRQSPQPQRSAPVLSQIQKESMPMTRTSTQTSDANTSELRAQNSVKSPTLGADSFATWGNAASAQASGGPSVWGSLSSNRRIGNGAFDGPYSRIAPQLNHVQQGDMPANAIAHQNQRPLDTLQDMRQQDTSPMIHQQHMSDLALAQLGLTDETTDDPSRPPHDAYASLNDPRRHHQPGPIAPPGRVPSLQNVSQQAGTSAWGQFAAQAQARATMDPTFQPRTSDEPRPTVSQNPQRWKETFKQTQVQDNWSGSAREIVNTEQNVHNIQALSNMQPPGLQGVISRDQRPQGGVDNMHQGVESAVRMPPHPSSRVLDPRNIAMANGMRSTTAPINAPQSRFFPSATYSGSPPPEEGEHPAHVGHAHHIHVHLPTPKPMIRLPRTASSSDAENRSVSGPHAQVSGDWKSKINGLLGRPNSPALLSPPRTPPQPVAERATAVHAATRPELHDTARSQKTTISLPQAQTVRTPPMFSAVSKDPVAPLFDSEREFGSTPTVTVPRRGAHRNTPRAMITRVPARAVDAHSKTMLPVWLDHGESPDVIVVHFAFSKRAATSVKMQVKPRHTQGAQRKASKQNNTHKRDTDADAVSKTPSTTTGSAAGTTATNSGKGNKQQKTKTTNTTSSTSTPRKRGGKAGGSSGTQTPVESQSALKLEVGKTRGKGVKAGKLDKERLTPVKADKTDNNVKTEKEVKGGGKTDKTNKTEKLNKPVKVAPKSRKTTAKSSDTAEQVVPKVVEKAAMTVAT